MSSKNITRAIIRGERRGTVWGWPSSNGSSNCTAACVEVESVLGQGSTFSVYLPLTEAAPTMEPAAASPPQETALDTREIMVPLELAELYRACCTSLGWQVISERPANQPGQLLKRWTLVRSQHWGQGSKASGLAERG